MPRHLLIPSLLSGLASGLLFVLAHSSTIGGPFLFIAALPLFSVGLRMHVHAALVCVAVGVFSVLLLSTPEGALYYLGFLGAPMLLFAPRAQLFAGQGEEKYWFPIGLLLNDLTLYGALVFLAVAAHYQADGGLQALLMRDMGEAMASADAELVETARRMMETAGFLMFSSTVWWWLLMLYAAAVLTNAVLKRQNRAVRPSLSLEPFRLPYWTLLALIAAGLAAILGEGEVEFAGETCVIIFLLPYFILGISILHHFTRDWPSRALVLFMLYATALIMVWPAMIIAMVGLWRQLKEFRSTPEGV